MSRIDPLDPGAGRAVVGCGAMVVVGEVVDVVLVLVLVELVLVELVLELVELVLVELELVVVELVDVVEGGLVEVGVRGVAVDGDDARSGDVPVALDEGSACEHATNSAAQAIVAAAP